MCVCVCKCAYAFFHSILRHCRLRAALAAASDPTCYAALCCLQGAFLHTYLPYALTCTLQALLGQLRAEHIHLGPAFTGTVLQVLVK